MTYPTQCGGYLPKGDPGPPGPPGSLIDSWRGPWTPSTVYQVGDVVAFDSGLYILSKEWVPDPYDQVPPPPPGGPWDTLIPSPDPVPGPDPAPGPTLEQVQEIADTAARAAADEVLAQSGTCCTEAKEAAADARQAADNAATLAQEARDALAAHLEACHTLDIVTEGVTPEAGWEVDAQELRRIGGVNHVFIRLRRTGGDLTGENADFTNSDGKLEAGNIIPDTVICRVPAGWGPPQSYVILGGNSYGHGSIRVHGTGEVYLLDWMTNNTIQDGYLLRFEYTFLERSACETRA